MEDIAETKGIPDKMARLDLLEQRRNGEITRAEIRHKAKTLKEGDPAKKEVPAVSARPSIPDKFIQNLCFGLPSRLPVPLCGCVRKGVSRLHVEPH
jgi:hypothetical protein